MAASNKSKEQGLMNRVKLLNKHVIEGKSIVQCSKEMGLSRNRLHEYKRSDDYRQMALEHLENSALEGVGGTVSRLVEALDAVRPHNKETRNADGSTNVEVEFVEDTPTRLKALNEVIKIYGLHAPVKKDTTLTISLSSDEDLFGEIDKAERACRTVESYEVREGSFELAEGAAGVSDGDFETRKRAILQDVAIPESE